MKLGCFAVGSNKMPRELIARKGIESLEDLRGKTFGVQSIGGGFWLSTMVTLDGLGLDPEKYQLNMRVIGDTTTVTRALIYKVARQQMPNTPTETFYDNSFVDEVKQSGFLTELWK